MNAKAKERVYIIETSKGRAKDIGKFISDVPLDEIVSANPTLEGLSNEPPTKLKICMSQKDTIEVRPFENERLGVSSKPPFQHLFSTPWYARLKHNETFVDVYFC